MKQYLYLLITTFCIYNVTNHSLILADITKNNDYTEDFLTKQNYRFYSESKINIISQENQNQKTKEEEQKETINQLLQRIEKLEKQVEILQQKIQNQSGQTSTETTKIPKTETPPPIDTSKQQNYGVEDTLTTKNALVLPPGAIEIQPSVTYANSSSDVISIDGFSILPVFVVGEITSERIRRDSVITSLTTRVGLPWDTQIDLRVPYRFESENIVKVDQTESDRTISGLGDLEIGISKQILQQNGRFPDVLLRLQWKVPTGLSPFDNNNSLALGTGFHGLRTGLTFVKSTDPAVIFGSLGYTINFADEKQSNWIDPGDTFDFSIGVGLALSNELSINFGWEQRFTNHTTLNNINVPGSSLSVGSFAFGFSYRLTESQWVDLGLNMGLTRDSPDFQITISTPIRLR